MTMPILLNVIFTMIILAHFNTFSGSPFSEMSANVLMYIGNWPSFLLKKYPFVIAGGGEVVYEGLGWTNPTIFIINLVGWGLLGFISSFTNRKRKQTTRRN
jgi:hypothetical protein